MESARNRELVGRRYTVRGVVGVLSCVVSVAFAGPPAKPAQPVKKSTAGQTPPPRIVKWVDDQGVTHYGDHLPAKYADHANTVLSGRGHLLQKNEAALPPEVQVQRKAEEKRLAEQQRRDKALLATYGSEQEIDLARDRHLQQDAVAIDNLLQDIASAQKRLATDTQLAKDLQARKKTVPEDLTRSIASAQQEIDRLQAQVAQKRQAMEATRQRFEEYKLRYRAAKEHDQAAGNLKPASASKSR